MEPTSFAALHAEVESRFLGAGPRPWPTPRTGHDGPADEEYSRRLHPEKYVITQQRATAWAVALVCFGAATVNSLGPENWRPGGAVVTTSITATRSGTEPVFLHFSSDYLPGVIVAYGSAYVVLTAQPVCGCDACDDGSDPLIDSIDDAFESVVLGAVLVEQGKRTARVVTINGESSSTGDRSSPNWVTGRWSGAPWLS